VAVAWLGWEAIARGSARALDEWVAVVTLAVGLWLGTWDLAMRRPRAAGGGVHVRARSAGRLPVGHRRAAPPAEPAGAGGLVTIVALYLIAFLAPLIAPYDPIAQGDLTTTATCRRPGHWLGTDQFGRDMLSRIIYGARISLAIGFIAVAIAIVLGSLLGAIAGYIGGKVDAALMRFTDMVMAFPRLVLLIMIIALFDRA
jgi:ABC-type dipeptide/oligopeptide/nickel transport system permease subunit